MTENNTSPDPQSEAPHSPSPPEKHSSLLSKDNKNEEKSKQNDDQQEIKNHHNIAQGSYKKNSISEDQKYIKLISWDTPPCLIDSSMRLPLSWENFITILKLFLILGIFTTSLVYATSQNSPENKILDFIDFPNEYAPLTISILLTSISGFLLFFKFLLHIIKIAIMELQKRISKLTNKYFISTLALLALLGGAAALIIPSYTNLFREPGYTSPQQDSAKEIPEKVQETPTSTPSSTGNKAAEVEQKSTSDLRLHLLYITGGVIAILGLIETNRKNSQDHIRQVHAARRDRYIQAIDKLSSKNASVRLGGIYALVGLVDEWLDDDNIDEEPRLKEGQVIINNLCSYIRIPFELADKREVFLEDKEPDNYPGNYDKDRSKFYEEYHIRESIFKEINNHLTVLVDGHDRDLSGPWRSFTFNFDNSPIFYDLIYLNYTNTSFNGAKFYARAIFENSHFFGLTDFTNAKFFGRTSFNDAFFIGGVSFRGAVFMGETSFQPALFKDEVHFDYADFTITATANFSSSLFCGPVNFQNTKFSHEPLFSGQSVISSENFPYSIEHAAKFSYEIPSQKHNFITSQESNFKIETKPILFRDIKYEIPIGSAIFDPGSFDKEKWEYTQVSEPAK